MSENKDMICTILNEDDTELYLPENPLKEKWTKLYPPIPKPNTAQICDGYGCMFCGRCPEGEYWKIPEEDREVWKAYREQVKEYHKIHNPSLYKKLYQD